MCTEGSSPYMAHRHVLVLPHGGVEGLVVLGALHTGAGLGEVMSTRTCPKNLVQAS